MWNGNCMRTTNSRAGTIHEGRGFGMSGLVTAFIKSLDKGTLDAFLPWRDQEGMAEERREAPDLAHEPIDRAESSDWRGNPRKLLEKMVTRYAVKCGILYAVAWHDFDRAFNIAYRTDLTILRRRYCERAGLSAVSRPAYFEAIGRLDQAIRVADKLLDQCGY